MLRETVVRYLKDNKFSGTAFAFFPAEVKVWCEHHQSDIMVFKPYDNPTWQRNTSHALDKQAVYALPDGYKINKEE